MKQIRLYLMMIIMAVFTLNGCHERYVTYSDAEYIIVDTGDSSTWNSTPIYIERGSAKIYYGLAKNEYIGTLEGTKLNLTHTYSLDKNNNFVISRQSKTR